MAATALARIYIGGLDPEVATTDVVGRFAPFGAVAGCELVPAKAGAAPGGSCRGFAYVDFIPHNEAALARVFSLVRAAWRLALRRARPILCVVIPGPLRPTALCTPLTPQCCCGTLLCAGAVQWLRVAWSPDTCGASSSALYAASACRVGRRCHRCCCSCCGSHPGPAKWRRAPKVAAPTSSWHPAHFRAWKPTKGTPA